MLLTHNTVLQAAKLVLIVYVTSLVMMMYSVEDSKEW